MELKTLWLGLIISVAVFALKTGLGWAYLWSKCPKGRKLPATIIVIFTYAVLFAVVFALVSKLNLLAHYEILLPLWQGGFTLHWLVAILLFVWGLLLLRTPVGDKNCNCGETKSKGWLALVIPCPVCLSVVLMATAGLVLYFPDEALKATVGLFVVFLIIAGLSGVLMLLTRVRAQRPLEGTLGLAMILMAVYFILTALLTPQFSEVGKVYRVASYARDAEATDGVQIALTWGVIALLVVIGFIWRLRKTTQAL